MAEVYRLFAGDWKHCLDFSDEMLVEMYNQESYGGFVSPKNGYAVGKKWLNVMVAMWREDIQSGHLFLWELYEDTHFPHWWLDTVFKEHPHKTRPIGQIRQEEKNEDQI